MTGTLASTLGDYPVMTAGGRELGTLVAVTMDTKTGALANLHVDPDEAPDAPFDRDDEGHLLIPADRVTAQGDYVLVEADG